jgi:hypothetical protein
MSQRIRTALVVIVGLVVLYFVADRLVHSPAFLKPRDFLEYWAAGAIALRDGNPYDPAELLRWQQLAEPGRETAVMMWNPPWSLAVYMPLGAMSPQWATLLWVSLQLVAVMVSCELLWRVYGGARRLRWVAQAVGVTFVGTWWMVSFGQNTGLLLLGLAGFAYFRKVDRPALAGAFAALTALKPHLLAAFGVLLVLDALLARRGRVALASGAAVLAASLGIALLANPDVVSHYREAVLNPAPGAVPLHGWILPVASYWIRVGIDPSQFWVQFVPCLMACVGFAIYRLWRGAEWDWSRELPLVVWLSVVTTPYGGWIFDLTVLLVPVVQAAVWVAHGRRPAAIAILAVGHVAILAVSLIWVYDLDQFWWVAPAVLAIYLFAVAARKAVVPPPAAPVSTIGETDHPTVEAGSWRREAQLDTGS